MLIMRLRKKSLLQIALIIFFICFSTLISSVDNLINFWLSSDFLILTGTSLTVLAVLFTCIYTVRTSAENSMHNANANFVANVADKRISEIWLEDSRKWRDFCATNTKIATMFLYSFILLAIIFFITVIVRLIKISLQLEIELPYISTSTVFAIIIFLTLLSILNLLRGFWCYIKPDKKLYKSKEKSCLTKLTGLLCYNCSPRFPIFNVEAKKIYDEYMN